MIGAMIDHDRGHESQRKGVISEIMKKIRVLLPPVIPLINTVAHPLIIFYCLLFCPPT